uniref:Transposase (Putative), gypsy type n=1 Tax=Tanacetum cinerariifolium TaxID=118510 RepID=A0A699H777_TANCI|nr:hypothetical protein [Tanacetum cinerariifolium]
MDLLLFIRTADHIKVRIGERERDEDEPKLLETTVGRVVSLLSVAPDRSSSELEASVDKLFDEGWSGEQANQGDSAGGGHGVGVQLVDVSAETVVEDVAPAELQRRKKQKNKVVDAGEPSHPTKKLRGDYEVPGVPAVVEGEVDYVVRTFVPIMTNATTATPTVDPAAIAKERLVGSSVFGGDSSFAGESHPISGGFSDRTGSDFLEPEAAEAVCLRDEAQALKERSTNLEKEKSELEVKVIDLAALVKVREQEVADLDVVVTSVKLQNDSLADQVHKLEASSAGLQEKVTVYENCVSQLEKFQDEKMKEVNEKFDKLYVDFVDLDLHLEDKIYPHLLTTIFGCRWLLTHDMELAIAKCLNSTEYLSALGAAIGKAIKNGMQKGLSAGIIHGAGGRTLMFFGSFLVILAISVPTHADYLSALQRLKSVNFPLIAKLKTNKDASVEVITNLLLLEDALAKKLSLLESHPHVDQIKENIANHVSALRGVFVPLSEPLFAMALEGTEGTSGAAPDTTTALPVTSISASTILPISTDDYEIAHTKGEEGVVADVKVVADEGAYSFPDVSGAELDVSK